MRSMSLPVPPSDLRSRIDTLGGTTTDGWPHLEVAVEGLLTETNSSDLRRDLNGARKAKNAMQPAAPEFQVDDYEAFVASSRRRFQRIVGGLVLGLLFALYLPWALASARVIKSSVAETVTCFSAFLLLCAWRALLTKLGDPNDAPTPESRKKHLLGLIAGAGGVIGVLLLLGTVSWLVGWIALGGVGWTILLSFMLGAMVVQALVWRAIRHGR